MKFKPAVSHDECVRRRIIESPEFAAEYLRAAMDVTEEPRVLMTALRRIAEARGVARIAKAAGISPQSLRRDLKRPSDPLVTTFLAVAKSIGLRLAVKPV